MKTVTKKKSYFIKHWPIYSMILPGLVYFLIFKYIPLGGSIIAFQDYNVFKGITGSEFVGFKHFKNLFTYPEFMQIFNNTLLISAYKLVLGFPSPIILALLLNEVRKKLFKSTIQSLLYLPHFLSWVIVGGLVINILSPSSGIVNEIIRSLGGKEIFFMQEPGFFRSIVVGSGIWKDVGWNTIIYMAALAGINPQLYEAAEIDGAGKLRQVWSITLPTLLPTIMILLLLQIGNILDLGFEQIYMLLNPLVRETGEVLDTYIYRVGLVGGQFSYTTAIGLFKSVIGLILVVGANKLSKKLTGNSIY
ncbi:binding-protein-dependent transport systems inner membrane component [Neobacillus bataviensis LMG 21833]|uniref:Binding-protein-dependent transport systems inner membrane component n=1 Tax=Neobacillus bataviensis LMG 21833 TaxID=1117379 RepID=K6CYE1_9BACI|nr:ABC transporter permease subunit [Neobacillus bataviensis]EKN65247.1 binding-protein-dependent transport systems inner membrane component [Neobacillus bataviensis LMG 21833]